VRSIRAFARAVGVEASLAGEVGKEGGEVGEAGEVGEKDNSRTFVLRLGEEGPSSDLGEVRVGPDVCKVN